jgi:hypothetical protein
MREITTQQQQKKTMRTSNGLFILGTQRRVSAENERSSSIRDLAWI